MAKIIGRLVKVGLGRETTRGIGVAPSMWLPQASISLASKVDEVRLEGALGSLADNQGKLVTEKYASGELGGELRDQSFGYLLYALLGSLTTTGPTDTSLYTHSFSLSESNQHTSLSVHIKDDNIDELYKLAMLNSLKISVELGGLVMFSADILSKVGVSASNTYTRPTDNKFSKKHVKIYLAASLATLGNATALDLKSFEITFNKNAERDSALGTVQPIDILNKQFSIEGAMSLNLTDTTIRDYVLNGSTKAMRIDIENADVTIGASSHPRLRIELPLVDFSGWEPDRSLNEIVKQSVNFKAGYDTTNGIISTCELKNAKASY